MALAPEDWAVFFELAAGARARWSPRSETSSTSPPGAPIELALNGEAEPVAAYRIAG